jgi:hypothetical protein
VPELPRLHDLIGLTDTRANDANGILKSYAGYRCVKQLLNKGQRLRLLLLLTGKPPRTAYRQVGAGRVRDHQIPTHIPLNHVAYIATEVHPRTL